VVIYHWYLVIGPLSWVLGPLSFVLLIICPLVFRICDSESNFINLDLGHRFSFYFNIKLHLDDIKVLHYIKQKLEAGKLYTHKNTTTFRISYLVGDHN
jgi:hypothetical protein